MASSRSQGAVDRELQIPQIEFLNRRFGEFFRVSYLTILQCHQQNPVLLNPVERDVLSISLRIRVRIILQPFLKEFDHPASVRITKINVTKVISVVKKQMPNLHVLAQFFLAGILVVLIFVAAAVKSRLHFVLREIDARSTLFARVLQLEWRQKYPGRRTSYTGKLVRASGPVLKASRRGNFHDDRQCLSPA